MGIDSRIWPKELPAGPMAILAIYASSGVRWYQYDPLREAVALATPPPDGDECVERVKKKMTSVQIGPWKGLEEGRPFTAVIVGVAVDRKPGATWAPSSSILLPRENGPTWLSHTDLWI